MAPHEPAVCGFSAMGYACLEGYSVASPILILGFNEPWLMRDWLSSAARVVLGVMQMLVVILLITRGVLAIGMLG